MSGERKTLLTGAGGFVGQALLARLLANRAGGVRAVFRRLPATLPVGLADCVVADLAEQDWREPLQGVSAVVHCAARVHVMDERSLDPLAEFRRVNVEGTLNLARQAAEAGVARFVFVSSIKVNGEETPPGCPYIADAAPQPRDPYAVSKLEAEQGLRALAAETGMEVVIIRPVLVYGPGVKANFRSLMKGLHKGIPLPLGAVCNRRSLVALDNLVDLLMTCLDHPAAANQVFLVSDDEDLSTTELLQRLGGALGKPARLLPVPEAWLVAAARLLGREAMARRLCGSLQVDIEKTRRLLGWTPPVSVDAALDRTARHFLEQR